MLRKAAFAGLFYPASKNELKQSITDFLEAANPPKLEDKIRALIVPHAGYIYSGLTAAYGYKLIEEKSYANVTLLGPSHHTFFRGLALADFSDWTTPLGDIKVNTLNKLLAKENCFMNEKEAHTDEHSLEVQLPFLQLTLKNFEITPIATGELTDHKDIANILNQYIDEKTLIVASSDLSHYFPYETAQEIDNHTLEQIKNLNPTIDHDQACGADGIKILIELAKLENWNVKILDYRNSGDTAGDKSAVVGYAAIAFTK